MDLLYVRSLGTFFLQEDRGSKFSEEIADFHLWITRKIISTGMLIANYFLMELTLEKF